MTGYPDLVNQDDDAHLLRAMAKKIADLEARAADADIPGATRLLAGQTTRANKWSRTRAESVNNLYTRWWQFNELNPSPTYFEDVSADPAKRLALSTGSVTANQLGGMAEGSYSIKTSISTLLTHPFITGVDRPTLDVIFQPTVLPTACNIIYYGNTGNNGHGIRIDNAAGGSGSLITFLFGGLSWYSSGVTAVAGRWYHVVVSPYPVGGVTYWRIGSFDPVTMQFGFSSGTINAVPGANTSNPVEIGGFDGFIDEALVYSSVLDANANQFSGEDRVRASLQPPPPPGYLVADGGLVSRNKYPRLFRRVGTFYSAGDGSTFGLPTLSGGIVKT